MESGLARLTSGGYIKEKDRIFSPTDRVMSGYHKTTSPNRPIHQELQDIEELIRAASATDEQPLPNDLKYSGFSIEAYDEVVNRYTANSLEPSPYWQAAEKERRST